MRRPQSFAQWLADNPVPDLQALVEQFGGFDRITAPAWEEFLRAREAWQMAYRYREA